MLKGISANIYKLYLIKIAKWFMLTTPFLMIFYTDHGLSSSEAFQIKAVYSILIVLLEIPSGYFADSLGRKKSLIIGAIFGTIGFVVYSLYQGFWSFLVAEALLGVGQSFISGSDSALLYDTLIITKKKREYARYEGRLIAIGNAAEAISAFVGGMIAVVSLQALFYVQAAVAAIAIPAAFTLVEPVLHTVKEKVKPSLKGILKIVHWALVEDKTLRWRLIYSSVIGTATLTMAWVYQVFLKNDLAFSNSHIGTTAAVLNVIVALITTYAWRLERRYGMKRMLGLIYGGVIIGYLLIGLFSSMWSILFLALFYVTRGIATPILKDAVNLYTPSEYRATVLSVRGFMIRLLFAWIGPLTGWMADKSSYSTALIYLSILFTALAIVPYIKLMRER